MSRKKNAVKKESRAGLSLLENLQTAIYGRNYDSRAAGIVQLLNEAILLERGFDALASEGFYWPGVYNQEVHTKVQASRHRLAWKHLSKAFLEAQASGDATIFQRMAEIIRCDKNPVDRAQSLVGRIFQICHDQRLPTPTVPIVQQTLRKLGVPLQYTQVKRYFEYFEIKPPAAQVGAPKKARGQL